MLFPFFDSSMILLIPALILAAWAQMRVKSTFARFSQVRSRRGVTAAQVARMLLDRAGLSSVPINRVAGELTDHYDPRNRSLNLSQPVFDSTSIASVGVAAHEVGHAIQHSLSYSPLEIRNAIAPVVGLGSTLAIPLFFIGLLMSFGGLMTIGIFLFVGVVIFNLVTLPVEFNASSRAMTILADTGALGSDELVGARSVLNAAAWTYVAATVMAVAQLLRLLVLRNSRE